MSLLLPMPKAHGLINIADIVILERQRKDAEEVRTFIDEQLMPSIAEVGLIQPIILADDEKELIAGWSRLQACKNLGYQQIAYNTQNDMPQSQRMLMEYEENETRSDIHWIDKVNSISKIYKLKKREATVEGKEWGVRQAGKLLGVSMGYVALFNRISDALRKNSFPGLENCKSITDAIKFIYGGIEDKLHKELAQRSAIPVKPGLVGKPIPKSKDNSSGPIGFEIDLNLEKPKPSAIVESINIPISQRFLKGNCLEIMPTMPEKSFDLIFTDIPYGIDMKNLQGMDGIERVEAQHDVQENLEQMPIFLKESYRLLKDKSWLIFFFSINHYEKLLGWADDAGFACQTYPLLWIKTHPCRNMSPHCSWTKATEEIFVARKGTATMRNTNYTPNYFACEGMTAKKQQSNPFAKPFEICEWILDKVAFTGQTCLDPYAGEGSICKAEIIKGLVPTGIEISDLHYDRLCNHMREQYKKLAGDQVIFS